MLVEHAVDIERKNGSVAVLVCLLAEETAEDEGDG